MKKLTASELLVRVKAVLQADTALTAWSQEHYSKNHTVYSGINNEDPPPETAYPLLVIFGVERRKSANNDRVIYSVEIGAGVFDDDVSDESDNRVHEGFGRVLEFRQLAESALITAHIAKADVNSDTITELLFPYFISNAMVEFEWPKGYDRPPR